MNWYLEVWKKYAVFDGRARRREYWTFFLVHFIIGCILRFVESFADIAFESSLYWSYWGAVFLPGMAVSVRRLHDTGRSGWWNLIALVPIFGAIVLLAFAVQDSDSGENQYGPNPKEISMGWQEEHQKRIATFPPDIRD